MLNGIRGSAYAAFNFDAIRPNRFRKADKDGDGQVSKEELSAVLPKGRKGPGVDQIFARVDTNQDGLITKAKNQAALEDIRSHRGSHEPFDATHIAEQVFAKVDQDKDGKISQAELEQVFKGHHSASEIENFFKTIDTDNDGSITQSELEGVLQKIFETLKAPGANTSYDNTGVPQPTTDPNTTFTQTA